MTDAIIIDRRFQGPPGVANGGYVCGRLAAYIDGPAAVRLRAPTPLEVPLEVRPTDDGVALVLDDKIIAQGRTATVDLDLPEPPTYAEAEIATRSFRGFDCHPLANCFVCGTRRPPGDGLRVFAGPVQGRELVACPWVPDETLGDSHGAVRPEYLWSALDCPGAFTFPQIERGVVLAGELSASLSGNVVVGERYIVVGWELGQEGRRHFTGTAIFSESGACQAFARTVWIEVPDFPVPHGSA